jgi:hypothetical protein
MPTRLTVRTAPRSKRIQAPSPKPDQRVARLLSTALPATLVSLVLAVTAEAAGVISMYVCASAGAWARLENPPPETRLLLSSCARDHPGHAQRLIPDPRGPLPPGSRRPEDFNGTVGWL